jgi:exodeoxyribonuclease V gamma subunit
MTIARIPPLGTDPDSRRKIALEALAVLVHLYDRGLREPLPIARATSAAYAQAAFAGEDAAEAAWGEWTSKWKWAREDLAPEHVLVFGEQLDFEELLALRPQPDERGKGWDETEKSRFGRLALRLWGDLMSHEQLSDR